MASLHRIGLEGRLIDHNALSFNSKKWPGVSLAQIPNTRAMGQLANEPKSPVKIPFYREELGSCTTPKHVSGRALAAHTVPPANNPVFPVTPVFRTSSDNMHPMNIINSEIEKTLNIFDESTDTASEQFEFNSVRGGRATVELVRDKAHDAAELIAAIRRKNGLVSFDQKEAKLAAETAIKSEARRFANRPAHVGWQIGKNGKPDAFVLGSKVIQPNNAEKLILAPSWLNCQWRAESPQLWRSKIPQFGGRGDQPWC